MQIRITKTRAAMAALFVLAGIGLGSLLSPLVGTALATAGQIVNISDRSGSALFAKVSSDGKLAVGDGAGPLSVDGTVASRPVAPASPWSASIALNDIPAVVAGPSASPINLTSLSLSTAASTGSGVNVILYGAQVPSATSCDQATTHVRLWFLHDLGNGVTPLSFTFPTPLQWKPVANTKGCLLAGSDRESAGTLNAVGFFGG